MTPGFIVEGQMEQRVVRRLCNGNSVRTFTGNGRDVSPAALAKQAGTQIRLMKKWHPIIVLFDREERARTCEQLIEEFTNALLSDGIQRDQFVVCVADRMVENWILACDKIRDRYNISYATEGCHGKAKLSSALRKQCIGYHETTIGVDMFCNIDTRSAANNSVSFKVFAEAIAPYCKWIKPPQKTKP